ncbi:MAG: PLP-dependent aminotransferase family protein [bacterium]
MQLRIDKESSVPAYQQIHEQIVKLVEDGLLEAGSRLPSVRTLSRQLGVSLATVQTAYEELEAINIIESRHGSGTFVTGAPRKATGTNLGTRAEMFGELDQLPEMRWEPYQFRTDFFLVPPPPRRESMIRFSIGNPDPALFPFNRIKQVTSNMLWSPQEHFFDLGHPQGFLPLVEHLEKEMALAGVPMAENENDIILTGGFQRGMSLILRLLLNPGQKVAVESPCYTGILNFLLAERIDIEPIPVDEHGMDTDYLATVLNRDEVKAIITIPTFHNPTGVTMSLERREHLIKLAARHRIPIIEDDWGRPLRYGGETPPLLKAMDPGGYVIHIGTYSKSLLPGLRIGWITCPAGLSVPLVCAKLGSDNADSYFLQALLHEFISKGYYNKHLRKTTREYRRRWQAMTAALEANLPEGCSFLRPEGGFSFWLNLPQNIMSLPLLRLAHEAGVDFLPASYCTPGKKDSNALRLSFSRCSVEEIELGIPILCELIARVSRNPSLLEPGRS